MDPGSLRPSGFPTEDAERNWKQIQTSGKRYHSWGFHTSIVLIQVNKRRYPCFYKALYVADGPIELLKTYYVLNEVEWHRMIRDLNQWNYHTLTLCPIVKMEIDATS